MPHLHETLDGGARERERERERERARLKSAKTGGIMFAI